VSGTHDNLKANATVQMQDADVTAAAPLQVQLGDGTTQVTVDTTSGGLLVAMYDTSGNPILNSTAVLGTDTYSEASTVGTVVGAVRNDDLATLADTDNETAPLQVDENGALYVTQGATAEVSASGVATDGTTAIVAALASHTCRIHALVLKATSATVTNVYLATTTDTDVMGNAGNPMPLAIDADADNDSGIVLPYNPKGWTTTSTANEALNLILSAAQDVIWMITYSYIPV